MTDSNLKVVKVTKKDPYPEWITAGMDAWIYVYVEHNLLWNKIDLNKNQASDMAKYWKTCPFLPQKIPQNLSVLYL